MINFFSSALVFLSLRRIAEDEGGLPTVGITRLVLVVADVVLFDVDATEASLSFEDSPGEALRFLRFLRGLPFNFGAEKPRDISSLVIIEIRHKQYVTFCVHSHITLFRFKNK